MEKRRRRERGAALVELALIVPAVALLVMGTVDLARAYRMNIRLEGAAREGAAFLQIYPNEITCTGVNNDLLDRVALEDPDLPGEDGYAVTALRYDGTDFSDYDVCDSQATPPVTPTVEPGDRVRVDVHATFDLITPLISNVVGSPIDMTGSAEVVAQGQDTSP